MSTLVLSSSRAGSPAVEASRATTVSQLALPWEFDVADKLAKGPEDYPAHDKTPVTTLDRTHNRTHDNADCDGTAAASSPLLTPVMPSPSALIPSSPINPETLHPALWLGHQMGRTADDAVPSGFAALDLELPGGGWPRRALTEVLLTHAGIGEVRLLGESLAALQRAGRLVMLFDPPAQLSASALEQLGFDLQQLLVVDTRSRVLAGADSLWALEQALKSGHVGGVVAWLPPRLRADRLRRLQLAAHAHDGPAFVLRESAAQQRPTAAPLRLALRPGGADSLSVRLLKRRGPPLESVLRIDLPPVLSTTARARVAAGVVAPAAVASAPSGRPLRPATFMNPG